MYELTGVVVHSGVATGGHYYAYIKEPGTEQVRVGVMLGVGFRVT